MVSMPIILPHIPVIPELGASCLKYTEEKEETQPVDKERQKECGGTR